MDYLQYIENKEIVRYNTDLSFKPYYKWITFNTVMLEMYQRREIM